MKDKCEYSYVDGKSEYIYMPGEGGVYVGKAYLHEDDKDLGNEKTGLFIAETRAKIKFLKQLNRQHKIQLKGIIDTCKMLINSSNCDKDSYEIKLIQKEIARRKKAISEEEEIIDRLRSNLKEYIDAKEDFYKRIRKGRQKGQN